MKELTNGSTTEEKLLEGYPAKLRDVLAAARELAGQGEPPTSPKLAGLTGYAEETIFRHRATLQGMGLWPKVGDDPPAREAEAEAQAESPQRPTIARSAPSLDKRIVSSHGAEPDPLAAEFEAMRCLVRLKPPAVRRIMAWAAAYFCEG